MLTKSVSQKYFNNALISMHVTRAGSLFEACWSLTKRGNLTITDLGVNRDGKAHIRHKIKSVDRLVGNHHLHAELPVVYKEFFQPFVTCASVLYIIVDWSGCCRKDVHMLRASVMYDGRGVTIYNEIHPQNKLGNRQVQQQFLANLHKQIPFGKRVVIVTDAGFATPWFDAVLKLGWNYIGRLKRDIKLLFNDCARWMRTKNLHRKANAQGYYEGEAIIGSSSSTPVVGNIYSYKKIPKIKKRQKGSKYPDVNKRHSTANRTPWIIATSLNAIEYGKAFIRKKYHHRMQIEQNFRDEKNTRFGFGLRFARSSCMRRIAVLCLIAHIAAFFLLMLGTLGERLRIQGNYQNNTSKRRVLSLLTLAKRMLLHEPPKELSQYYKKAFRQLIMSSEALYEY